MAQEAATTIVLRMRDEATPKMERFGQTLNTTSMQGLQLTQTMTAMGSALVAIGSLMNQIDNPTAKMAANFFLISGAILSTISAIATALPSIIALIQTLRGLVIVQSILAALSGVGLPVILGALAVGGVVAATVAGLTSGATQSPRQVIEIRTDSPFLDDAALDRVARRITESQRKDISRGR